MKKNIKTTTCSDVKRAEEGQLAAPAFRRPLLHMLAIIALGILVYFDTFQVPFLFDDVTSISENPLIKDLNNFLSIEGLKNNISNTRLVGYFSFALNYKIHGLDLAGYHAVNLIIHLINALLVYCLIIVGFKTPVLNGPSLKHQAGNIAFFAALLFVCHPIQTQAVTYIAQRVASLATMFYLLSLVFYIKWRLGKETTNQKWFFYIGSLVSAVFAMKTKEIAFTLPLVIMLYEFMFFRGDIRKRLLFLLPILMTMLIIPLSMVNLNKPVESIIDDVDASTRVQTRLSRMDYLFTQFRVIMTYIRLLLFPVDQNLDYDYPKFHSLFDPEVFLSFMFLAFIAGLGVYLLKRTKENGRLVSFGIFWFFVTLSVESGIVPIIDVIYEHRVYLPSAGFFLVSSIAVFSAAERFRLNGKPLFYACAIIISIFTSTAYLRNTVWITDFTIWEDVVSKSPNNARAYNNLGNAYTRIGKLDEAMEMLNKAIAIFPDYPLPYHNRGELYLRMQDFNSAIMEYEKSVAINPKYFKSYIGLGMAYAAKGQQEESFNSFSKALTIKSNAELALNGVGLYYAGKNDYEKAILWYQKSIDANPRFPTVYVNRGKAYMSQGEFDKAITDFNMAIQFDYSFTAAYTNRGIAHLKKGTPDLALADFNRAIEINPKHEDTYYNRGELYLSRGENAKAVKDFHKCCDLGNNVACMKMKSLP